MKKFNTEKITDVTPNFIEQKKKNRRLALLLLILFLLLTISSCSAGFLIGRINDVERYTGRIIDSIFLTPGVSAQVVIPKTYCINVKGKIIYSDGSPYPNGTVELKSQPRYTITDSEGVFSFNAVEIGNHVISVIENGVAIAQCKFSIEINANKADSQIIKLDDGSYLVQVSVDVSLIDIIVELADNSLIIKPDIKTEQIPADSETLTEQNEADQTDSTRQLDTKDPNSQEESISSTGQFYPKPPISPTLLGLLKGAGGSTSRRPPNKTPNIMVSEGTAPSQIWTQSTAVDIFAERPGNKGVRTIDGYHVIAPGAIGKYIFKLNNPENFDIAYTLRLFESDQNNPKLPMKYRLKKGLSDNNYIGGNDWKNAQSILASGIILPPHETQYYTLEWKWESISDIMDTAIGTQSGNPVYVLEIIINAEFN